MADLLLYWADHPPVHVLLNALLIGLGGGSAAAAAPGPQHRVSKAGPMTDADFSQLIGAFGQPQPFQIPCRMLEPAPAT